MRTKGLAVRDRLSGRDLSIIDNRRRAGDPLYAAVPEFADWIKGAKKDPATVQDHEILRWQGHLVRTEGHALALMPMFSVAR